MNKNFNEIIFKFNSIIMMSRLINGTYPDTSKLIPDNFKIAMTVKLDEYIDVSPYMSNTVLGRINDVKNISKLSDIIVAELPLEYTDMLKYISITNPMLRIRNIIEDLSKEIETVRLENQIEDNLKIRMEEEQKEYMLKEKIRLIKEELGEVDPAFTNVE